MMSIDGMDRSEARKTYGEPVDYVKQEGPMSNMRNLMSLMLAITMCISSMIFMKTIRSMVFVLHKDELIEIESLYNHPSIEENEIMHYYLLNSATSLWLSSTERVSEHDVARKHSQDMASRHFFDHENPDGSGLKERLMAQDVDFSLRVKISQQGIFHLFLHITVFELTVS